MDSAPPAAFSLPSKWQARQAAPSGVQYASQTRHGIQPTADGRIEWALVWRAPDPAAGEVVFHVAGNAANHDASPLGDFIYTTARTSQPR